MDILKIDSTITVKMTKEELTLVVESLDRAISMIDLQIAQTVIGKEALLRELKPVSMEFTRILREV